MQDNSISGPGDRGLAVEGLTKSYGSTRALRGLSLAAEPDQVIGIVGPNGAGKSTLVRILAGEETEDAGTVSLGGRLLVPERRRRVVAVVHQEPQLFPNLTVVENLMIDRQGVAKSFFRHRGPRLALKSLRVRRDIVLRDIVLRKKEPGRANQHNQYSVHHAFFCGRYRAMRAVTSIGLKGFVM